MEQVSEIGKGLFSFLATLYLFGKSDVPVATLPPLVIALVLSGPSSLGLVTKALIWLELHLLTFQIKNQIDGIEEDTIAKPHRPLPSGRITPSQATRAYYILFALMWIAAIRENTLLCTLVYSIAIVIYNEGGLAAIPIVKNVIGAIGLGCYCWGTTTILDNGTEIYGLKAVASLMPAAIFATTGHAQDFRDRSADLVRGRKTIPLLISQPVARWSLAVLIVGWTVGLIGLWKPPVLAALIFAAAGLQCLCGFLRSYDEKHDYVSYIWYGFWILCGASADFVWLGLISLEHRRGGSSPPLFLNFAGLSVDAVRVFSISVVLHAALETMLEEFAKNDKGEIQDKIEARQISQSDLTKIVTDTDVEGNVFETMNGRVIKSGTSAKWLLES